MSVESGCFEIASAGEPAHLREFMIRRNDVTYCLQVSYPHYLEELRLRNVNRPPEVKVDENIYIFEDVSSAEQLGGMSELEICQRLAQIPQQQLQPYLTEQLDIGST